MKILITGAYEAVATSYRKNIFALPSGKQGKRYVKEMTRLLLQEVQEGPLQLLAGKAKALMPHLLMQRTAKGNKKKQDAANLGRRLDMWEKGEISELLKEATVFQNRIEDNSKSMSDDQLNRLVSAKVFDGKMTEAAGLVERHGWSKRGGVLPLTSDVVSALQQKHPRAEGLSEDQSELLRGVPPDLHPAIFDSLTPEVVKKAFLHTNGAAGVSGADSGHWKRAVCSFGTASTDLKQALADKARKLCTEYMDPEVLQAYLNNRLVPLSKNPGVRPIGIGEVERRALGKAILSVLKSEVLEASGVDQMCTGQPAACEAVVHAMRKAYENEAADGLVLVDADNAFNRLKRTAALLNIRFLCPPLSICLINCYRCAASLYVSGGLVMSSEEGVTQGDPLAMVMYGLALLPLIRKLNLDTSNSDDWVQSWYADDGQAVGKLRKLREWWDLLVQEGPKYGYYPQAAKTWLVVKPAMQAQAAEVFEGTGIKIAEEGGKRDLGAAVGTTIFQKKFVNDKVSDWADQVRVLAGVAKVQPHAAHALLIHALRHRWTFVQRIMGYLSGCFQELEQALSENFIPALFGEGSVMSSLDREVYGLPARMAGLSIENPEQVATGKYDDSVEFTSSIQEAILAGGGEVDMSLLKKKRQSLKNKREKQKREKAEELANSISEDSPMWKALQVSSDKGASAVFSVRPLERYNLCFRSKRDFRDLLALRYGKNVVGLQSVCACGKPYSVSHSQQCLKGGFIIHRHNEFEFLFAKECRKVFVDVGCEPILQELSGEEMRYASANRADEARSDVRVLGFWGNRRYAFFDFKVFYPFATTYFPLSLASAYRSCSKAKKREYQERVERVEDGSFTPMVMTSAGGMGPEMSVAVKFLAAKIAAKEGCEYSEAVSVLRAKFSFAAARTTLVCLRGSRSLFENRRACRSGGDDKGDDPSALVAALM